MLFIEDILRYVENEEEEEYEMNQQYTGIQELFQEYVLIDWKGINLKSSKYKKLNKIITKKYIEYYDKCWKHRNKEYYDKEKQ